MWCKRNDLTTNKLSIFLSVVNFANHAKYLPFHGQRQLSMGLQLQQMVQNHTATSNYCLTCSQVGAKGAVIPPILDRKYSSFEIVIVMTT